jgi:hypothetical protein
MPTDMIRTYIAKIHIGASEEMKPIPRNQINVTN